MSLFLHPAMFRCSPLPVFRTIEEVRAKATHVFFKFYFKSDISETSQSFVVTPCSLVICFGATCCPSIFKVEDHGRRPFKRVGTSIPRCMMS